MKLIKLWKVYEQNKWNIIFVFFIDLENRDKRTNEIVHVINIDVIDNPEDATLGAFMLCELGQKMEATVDLDNSIDEILTEFEQKTKRTILHAVSFY